MSSKRILIFSLAYYPVVGGAEVAIKEITDRLPDMEFDMITLRFNPKTPAVERIGNVNVYRIGGSKNLFPFQAFFFAKRLHKKNPYDAIWAMMANWAGFAALFFKYRFPTVKYILTLQEGDPIEYIKKKVRFVYPLFKRIFTKADTLQAISNYLAEFGRSMGYSGRLEIIPNGVDVEKFKGAPISHEGIVLITTSRLVEKNGIGDVIDALEYLSPSVRFVVIGVGPLEAALKRKVRQKKLESRVAFLGFMDLGDIPNHLHAADIFIRPSLSEGMGISFVEAMAAGLPVIATPVGGIPDFLVDGETGLFCEVRDPQSIADAVKKLQGDLALRQKIVENGRKLVEEKYDWDLIAGEMRSKVFYT